jgi:hypothetical protein
MVSNRFDVSRSRMLSVPAVARRAVAILALMPLVLCVSCVEPEPPASVPPLPPHDGRLSDENVVGCYELLSLSWVPELRADEQPFFTPPRSFALVHDSSRFPSRRIVSRAPTTFDLASWGVTIQNELEASWGTGLGGVRLIVRRRSTDGHFHGRAEPWTDSGPPPSRGKVEFRQVACG